MRTLLCLLPLLTFLGTVPLGSAQAQSPQLLKDLNDLPLKDSDPQEFTRIGANSWLFSAWTQACGRELYRWDGGSNVTMLADTYPGRPGYVQGLRRVGNVVVFRGGANAVWVSDGTASGTKELAAIHRPQFPANWKGTATMPFLAFAGGSYRVYHTDGTTAGTVARHNVGSSPRDPYFIRWQHNGSLHSILLYTHGTGMMLSDGTAQRYVGSGSTRDLVYHIDANGTLTLWSLRTSPPYALYRTRLTSPTATPTTQFISTSSYPGTHPFCLVGDYLYFAKNDATNGNELWRMAADGAPTFVHDIRTGSRSSNPQGFLSVPHATHPYAIFRANTGRGSRLYRVSDTTVTLLDTTSSGYTVPLLATERFGYFSRQTTTHGRELWRTDGTALGTKLAHDFAPGPDDGNPKNLAIVSSAAAGDVLLLGVTSGNGAEPHLYSENGPTQQLDNIAADNVTGDSVFSSFVESPNGTAWLTARTTAGWMNIATDGTSNGTTTIDRGQTVSESTLVFTDDWKAYYPKYDPLSGTELWVSDGTTAGTQLVHDLNPGSGSSYPRDLTSCAGRIFHTADDGRHGRELCERGKLHSDIYPGYRGSNPQHLVRCGNFLFFSAEDGRHGRELWVLPWRTTNGSTPPPRMIRDIYPGNRGSNPHSLIPHANSLYFIANDGVHGNELWRTDGSGNGTFMVADVSPGPRSGTIAPLVSTGAALFFTGYTPATGREPWFSNGYQATRILQDINPGPSSSNPRDMTMIHFERVALSAENPTVGRELYLIQSTGNTRLFDLVPGTGSSDPKHLFFDSNHLYFSATEPATGREPWRAQGIYLSNPERIADIWPGPRSSWPENQSRANFSVALRHVIFPADDGVHGVEPWVLPAGGISRSIGQGCGGHLRQPHMSATAARIGGGVQFYVAGVPTANVTATLWSSLRPVGAISFGLCQLQLDPASLLPVQTMQVRGKFITSFRVPNDPSLNGMILRTGLTLTPSTDPVLGFDLLNAVELRLGY